MLQKNYDIKSTGPYILYFIDLYVVMLITIPTPPPKLALAGKKSADCSYYLLYVTLFQRSTPGIGGKRKTASEGEGRKTGSTPKKTRKRLQNNAKENEKQAQDPGKYFQRVIAP